MAEKDIDVALARKAWEQAEEALKRNRADRELTRGRWLDAAADLEKEQNKAGALARLMRAAGAAVTSLRTADPHGTAGGVLDAAITGALAAGVPPALNHDLLKGAR